MLGAALDLATRRMPPADAPRTLKGLLRLLSLRGEEVLAEELLSQLETEQPLEEAVDPETVIERGSARANDRVLGPRVPEQTHAVCASAPLARNTNSNTLTPPQQTPSFFFFRAGRSC